MGGSNRCLWVGSRLGELWCSRTDDFGDSGAGEISPNLVPCNPVTLDMDA
jgi:hypothetical protein